MAKKYITDKLSAKTASSGITYEGDAIFNGGPDGTFSFDFNNGTTSEFSVNFAGDDFLTVNGGTGVFEAGDIAGLFDHFYLKVDPSNNLLSWKTQQDDLVTFGENSTVSLYGTGTNNASGAELHILKGQSNEVSGKLKLNYTTQYLDLEYEDPGATNIFRLYRDYSYTSQPIRIGANAAANELDDYEEGTFNQTFHIFQMGGVTSYDISDFGGGVEDSYYVKIGRLVMCNVYLYYNSVPSAWATSGSMQTLGFGLPFTAIEGVGHGSWNASGNTSNINSHNLQPYIYGSSSGFVFESTRSSGGYDFNPIYPYELLTTVPHGITTRTLRMSYSFYTND